MLQSIYLRKVTVTKQHNRFFTYTENCTKAICKFIAAR